MDAIFVLQSIEEIRVLKARYWRSLDARQWDEYRSVFTDDAILEFPEIDGMSADDFVAWSSTFLEGAQSIHRGYAPEIEIVDETNANGIWAFEDRLFWNERQPGFGGIISLQGDGHYHEQYKRVDGAWKIHRLRNTRQRCITTTAGLLTLPSELPTKAK